MGESDRIQVDRVQQYAAEAPKDLAPIVFEIVLTALGKPSKLKRNLSKRVSPLYVMADVTLLTSERRDIHYFEILH